MRPTLSLLIASAVLALGACAQDVGDVDRTQPNRLKKSLFEGEWFVQKTTFDVPYTAGFTFTGETSELERVRWEIQQDYLIAYRTYDLVENTQRSPAVQLPDAQTKGAPIAAYAITAHLDVVREYNSQTGEETNVISENEVDRPWYDREYVRVDWSKNLVLSFAFIDDQVSQSPIGYFVQDRTDADRLLAGVRTEDGSWVDVQDDAALAALDSAEYLDVVDTLFANPEVFRETDEYGDTYEYPACWYYSATDCQPARIKIRSSFMKVRDTDAYEALAYPDNAIARDAAGVARRDSDGNLIRIPYFDRFGYFRVERDYYDRERERTEEGRTYLISRWGIWQDAPACKDGDSYARCTVRPIVYYLSPQFPAALEGEAVKVIAQWNEELKTVVRALKYGDDRPLSQVEDVMILRGNDYIAGQARGQRIGDLRYPFLYYVPEPQAASPLGYGPSAVDPLSGRIVSASAYVYGAPLESWSTWAADVVELLNGVIPTDRFIEGEDVREYVTRLRGDYASAASNSRRLEDARAFGRSDKVKAGRAKQKALGKRRFALDRSKVRDRLSRIEGTPVEARLLSDEVVRALEPQLRGKGDQLASSLTPAMKRRMSPARWGTTSALKARERQRTLRLRQRSLELAAFADDAVIGLAEALRGLPRDQVRNTILARLFSSTAEHEVGHTLGLRHNFGGSYDALNYHPDYWALRGSSPQPFAAMTEAQASGRMQEFQYASIMDYGARFNSDIHGLGAYDKAAIHFGYGQLVHVFEDGAAPAEPLAAVAGLPYALHELRHYTSLPRLFGGDATRLQRRRLVPYRELVEQAVAGQPGLVEVPFRFCSDEYEGTQPWCAAWDEGADAYEIAENASTAYENYYIFNSFSRSQRDVDAWTHLNRVHDRYFLHLQNQYQHWVYRGFDLDGFWEELRGDAAAYGIEDVAFDEAVDGGLAGANAAKVALTTLSRVVQAPEPGAYYQDPDDGNYYNYSYDTEIPLCRGVSRPECSDLNVDLGTGKYAFSLYDGESGYYFYDRLKVIGSFYDKLAAIQTITSPETNFLGVDTTANFTQYAISMFLYFPEEVTRIIGGSAVDGYGAFAGVVEGQRFVFRDPFADPALYAGKAAVDPATSFTIELYSMWLGMAFLNANFDNSFNDGMRIWIDGSGEGQIPTVTDPARVARFTHARTGRTYVAVRAAEAGRYSPGFDLVSRAQAYASGAVSTDPQIIEYYVELTVSLIDAVRGLNKLYGDLVF